MTAKNIMFINIKEGITFDQRLTIKDQIVKAIEQAGHSESIYPIILENGATAEIYDKELINKISANTDAVLGHTLAMQELTNVLISALGIDDEEEQPGHTDNEQTL